MVNQPATELSEPSLPSSPQMNLVVHVVRDFEAMSQLAAAAVVASLQRAADRVERRVNVVLSAGRTPAHVYDLLATDFRYKFDWSRVSLFQMDEYVDAPKAIQPFSRYLARQVVIPLGVSDAHLLSGAPNLISDEEWAAAIRDEERKLLECGGIDLVVHGVGENGHLGFNEPGSSPTSRARIVRLSSSTRAAISPGPSPTRGVTLGMATLLAARESILLASGMSKAQAIAAALEGAVSTDCPASWLRLGRQTTMIIDGFAASDLH